MVSVTAASLESMCLWNRGTRGVEEEPNEKMRGERGLDPRHCGQLCTRDHFGVQVWTDHLSVCREDEAGVSGARRLTVSALGRRLLMHSRSGMQRANKKKSNLLFSTGEMIAVRYREGTSN